jgi:hypothetical protein
MADPADEIIISGCLDVWVARSIGVAFQLVLGSVVDRLFLLLRVSRKAGPLVIYSLLLSPLNIGNDGINPSMIASTASITRT